MKLIIDAVDEMIVNLKKNRTWNNAGVRGVLNIRLDLEVGDDWDKWVELRNLVVTELTDMVVNGDTAHATDPLLRAFDGENKLGSTLTKFDVTSAILEEKRTEASSFLTLYFKVCPEFDGEAPAVREATATKETLVERGEEAFVASDTPIV